MMAAIPDALLGMVYAIIILISVSALLYLKKLNRTAVLAISFVTAMVGLLLHAPLIPLQMQSLLINGSVGNGMPWFAALIVIVVLIASSILVGRVFCGYACPIGALQELVYAVPLPKLKVNGSMIIFLIHLAATLLFFALGAVWSFSLLGSLGARDLFFLQMASVSFYVFLAILVLGLFYYRPFCRLICPFGLFAGILARWSVIKIRKGNKCNSCGRCDRSCPTGVMSVTDSTDECFLCLRCDEVCRQDATIYTKKEVVINESE